MFLVYLITYPLIRFGLEFLRLDSSQVGGININQYFMAVVAVLAAAALIWRHRPGQSQPAPEPQPETEAEEAGSTPD